METTKVRYSGEAGASVTNRWGSWKAGEVKEIPAANVPALLAGPFELAEAKAKAGGKSKAKKSAGE